MTFSSTSPPRFDSRNLTQAYADHFAPPSLPPSGKDVVVERVNPKNAYDARLSSTRLLSSERACVIARYFKRESFLRRHGSSDVGEWGLGGSGSFGSGALGESGSSLQASR